MTTAEQRLLCQCHPLKLTSASSPEHQSLANCCSVWLDARSSTLDPLDDHKVRVHHQRGVARLVSQHSPIVTRDLSIPVRSFRNEPLYMKSGASRYEPRRQLGSFQQPGHTTCTTVPAFGCAARPARHATGGNAAHGTLAELAGPAATAGPASWPWQGIAVPKASCYSFACDGNSRDTKTGG